MNSKVVFVESDAQWLGHYHSRFGHQTDVFSVKPEEASLCTVDATVVVLNYEKSCLEFAFAVFDKNHARLENQSWILVDAPVDPIIRSRFRELGFVEFVDQLSDLDLVQKLRQTKASPPSSDSSLKSELFTTLPWGS